MLRLAPSCHLVQINASIVDKYTDKAVLETIGKMEQRLDRNVRSTSGGAARCQWQKIERGEVAADDRPQGCHPALERPLQMT